MPMVGLGLDSMGGGDVEDYHFRAAWYYAAQAGLAIGGLGPIGILATAGRYWRGSIDGSVDAHVAHETRLSLRLNYSRYSLAARYVAYDDSHRSLRDHGAKLIGGGLGIAF